MNSKESWKIFLFVVFLLISYSAVSEGWKDDRVKLHDVNVLTLRQGHMTNGRRSAPVPQMKCVGGSAGCSAFVPKVVQCYNRGSDGYDIQWECKADMDNEYRFGEIAVSCEGYDYPEDPYILKGSCGLEYTIDHVGGNSGNAYHHSSSYQHSNQHGNYGYKQHRNRVFPCSISTLIMWGIIAFIVYYIYSTCSANQHMTDSTQDTSQQSTHGTPPPPYTPPPPGFRSEYTQDQRAHTTNTGSSSSSSSSGLGGFWSGFGTGGLAGYLFGSSRGHDRTGYYHHDPYYTPGYNRGYGNGWFGSNSGNTGWFGGNSGNTGWFGGNSGNTGWFGGNRGNTGWFSNRGSSGSTFGTTHRRSSPTGSSSGSRTASGFGGTKRR